MNIANFPLLSLYQTETAAAPRGPPRLCFFSSYLSVSLSWTISGLLGYVYFKFIVFR